MYSPRTKKHIIYSKYRLYKYNIKPHKIKNLKNTTVIFRLGLILAGKILDFTVPARRQ